MQNEKLRNVAIIAHVDHGKTTLVDEMLKQGGVYRENQETVERVMDSNDLERERGITIFSKQAMLFAGDKEFTLLDTPGHVDFSAEMERTLSVLDYAVLVISGSDGVQSHTNALAPAHALRGADVSFHQQDGLGGRGQGRASAPAHGDTERGMRRFLRIAGNARRSARPLRRGGARAAFGAWKNRRRSDC